MPTLPPNHWKEASQYRKAFGVSLAIWGRLTREERTNPRLPDVVAAMSAEERFGWAIEAHVPALSDESWELCVSLIRDRMLEERQWLSIEAAG